MSHPCMQVVAMASMFVQQLVEKQEVLDTLNHLLDMDLMKVCRSLHIHDTLALAQPCTELRRAGC